MQLKLINTPNGGWETNTPHTHTYPTPSSTSLTSYESITLNTRLERYQEIFGCLTLQAMTREELAINTKRKESSICGRVDELLKAGHLKELQELGVTKSNRPAKLLTFNFDTRTLYDNAPSLGTRKGEVTHAKTPASYPALTKRLGGLPSVGVSY